MVGLLTSPSLLENALGVMEALWAAASGLGPKPGKRWVDRGQRQADWRGEEGKVKEAGWQTVRMVDSSSPGSSLWPLLTPLCWP